MDYKSSHYLHAQDDSQMSDGLESLSLSMSTVTGLNGEPPIPPTSTYGNERSNSPTTSPQQQEIPPSASWDYDNFIEKPKNQQIHNARGSQNVQGRFNKQGVEDNSIHLEPSQTTVNGIPLYDHNESQKSYNSNSPFAEGNYTSIGVNQVLLAVLSYFFGWLGGLIIIFMEKKNLYVLFHAFQSLGCGVIAFAIQILFIWSNTMYRILWIAYAIFLFYLIVQILKDSPPALYKVPIVGDWAEKRALNKIQQYTASHFYRMA